MATQVVPLGTGAQGTLLWVCHLGACRSSYQLRICVVLSCGVERTPPELSESSLLASFDSNKHLNQTFLRGVSALNRNGEGSQECREGIGVVRRASSSHAPQDKSAICADAIICSLYLASKGLAPNALVLSLALVTGLPRTRQLDL